MLCYAMLCYAMLCYGMPCHTCCAVLSNATPCCSLQSHAVSRGVYEPAVAYHVADCMCQQQQCSWLISLMTLPVRTLTHLVCLSTQHCSAAEPALAAGKQLP